MEISTTGPTWITATADGERAAYRLFEAGDRLTIRARDEVSFRLGNAGAFEYSINGAAGTPVGGPGDVRHEKALWLGFALGLVEILFFLHGLGFRHHRPRRGRRWRSPFGNALAAVAVVT